MSQLIEDIEAARTLALRIDADRVTVDCGHVAIPHYFLMPDWQTYAGTPGQGVAGGTGYATMRDGRKLCYPCADDVERAEMDTAETFTAYLSSDGKSITTWTGGHLAHVQSLSTSKRYTPTGGQWHAHYVTAIRNGVTWHGVNAGTGMVITLRRSR